MKDYDLWFSSLKISPKNKFELLEKYTDTENIYNCLGNKYVYDSEKIDNWKKIMIEKNINVVKYSDEDYPKKLMLLNDPPFLLYYKGNIKELNSGFSVSIVGSRNCSTYGMNVTKIISKGLAENNIPVISGMARGIDTHAHYACVENKGYTCAVLGSGVDVIYPKENRVLYQDIIKKGCVFSEFVPETPPFSYNFPVRNRLISALGDLIIVIEASEKSGSLITVNKALDIGKKVMVVPGSIFSEQSKGSNRLIKEGADLFLSMEDIFNTDVKYLNNYIESTRGEKNVNKELICIKSLIGNSPIHIDDIIKLSNIDIKRIYELLFEMQFKNEILCLSGNYYVKINDKI